MIQVHQINHAALTAAERLQTLLNPDVEFIKQMWKLGQFQHVANVNTTALDSAFLLTNSIDDHWSKNEEVEVLVPKQRSTSVGDVLACGGKRYLIATSGFVEL